MSFLPVSKNTDEFQVKADCENFYRRLRLRAHYFDADSKDFNAKDDDPFVKYNVRLSNWTPPEGKFSAVDHYIDRCRRQINKVNFRERTTYANLSLTEKQALHRLSKQEDIVIKPADKGGAVVVWKRSLYL